MKLRFKDLDMFILNPFTGRKEMCRFIDVDLYPYLYKLNKEWFIIDDEPVKLTKKKVKKDDISNEDI
jgi:hypothetical protein